MYTVEQFLQIIKPIVQTNAKQSGILASLTAAQALIESNKGNSGLTQKANNLFGMKGSYNGQSIMMPTKEWSKAKGYYTINAAFRKYPDWSASISDHSALFNSASRYSNLRGCKDYKLACRYVREDGYATSPTYTSTLAGVIEKYKLYEWDNSEKEYTAGLKMVTANVLNLRQKADASSNDLGDLLEGTKIVVDKVDGKWGHIEGWINLDYVQ